MILLGAFGIGFGIYLYCHYVTIQFMVRDVSSTFGNSYFIHVVFPKDKVEEVRRFMLEYYNKKFEKKFSFGALISYKISLQNLLLNSFHEQKYPHSFFVLPSSGSQ